MGLMPRSGLTPEVKRQFSKHKINSPLSRMPRKSKVCTRLVKEKLDDQMQTGCRKRNTPEKNFSSVNKEDNDLLKGAYTPISGVNILTDFSNRNTKKSTNRKRKNSDIIKRIKVTDKIVKETPSSSLESATKTFYCSQNLYESAIQCDPNIMQTILPSVAINTSYCTQTEISQSSIDPTIDDSRTISGLDAATNDTTQLTRSQHISSQKDIFTDTAMNLNRDNGTRQDQSYVMSQLYNSQKLMSQKNESINMQNQEYVMTQLYDSCSLTQKHQTSSKVVNQTAASVNSCPVNIIENLQEPDKIDCSPPVTKKFRNSNLIQSAPIEDMTELRRKLPFGTLAKMYHNGAFMIEENFSDRSRKTEVSYEENCSPRTTATSSAHFSMINNPPTEYIMQYATNIISKQEKFHNLEKFNTDFQGTSEFTTPFYNSQKFLDSFPSTPEDNDPLMLPPTLLLSNYCSEYDKAYTMKDLKPNRYRNYRHNESLRSLKEHLDSIIPPDVSLKDHYKITNLP